MGISDRRTAIGPDLRGQCLGGLRGRFGTVGRHTEVIDHDRGAAVPEKARVLTSHTASGTGDNGDPPVESQLVHGQTAVTLGTAFRITRHFPFFGGVFTIWYRKD